VSDKPNHVLMHAAVRLAQDTVKDEPEICLTALRLAIDELKKVYATPEQGDGR
jgi:hypothetical protein